MIMSFSVKRPGSRMMVFVLSQFWSFFLASVLGSIVTNFIGLNWSLAIFGGLLIVANLIAERLVLKRSLKIGAIELIGTSGSGIAVYKIEDPLANALAVGIGKHFGYIIITTGLMGLLGEKETEYKAIVEHEENHVNQMHNLTTLLTQVLLLVVWLSVLSTITLPFLLILNYILIDLMVLILSSALHRSFETRADETSDPVSLHAALVKMDELNRTLRNKGNNRGISNQTGLFSSHPKTEERPKKPSQIQIAAQSGMYISFLVIISLIVRIVSNLPFNGELIILAMSISISTIVFVTGFVVIDYLFLFNLIGILTRHFKVKSFYPTNALNGIIALLVVSGIPLILNVTDQTILICFVISSLIIAVIISAIGTDPFKKGIFSAMIGWIINSGIFLITLFPLIRIVLLGI